MSDLYPTLFKISLWAIPVLIAITFHEAAHGWAAWKLGDDTAKRLGRVTFNPIKHIDPVGTLLIPGLLLASGAGFIFGFAKPVPVAFHRLRNPRRDLILVAAAGPGINILLACASALLINFLPLVPDAGRYWAASMLEKSILINLVLATFNMIPIPPLDGGRIAVGLLPLHLAQKLAKVERYGFFIVLGLIFLLPRLGDEVGVDLNYIWNTIQFVVNNLLTAIITMFVLI
jgi:Zn-dependent protease